MTARPCAAAAVASRRARAPAPQRLRQLHADGPILAAHDLRHLGSRVDSAVSSSISAGVHLRILAAAPAFEHLQDDAA